MIASFPHTSLPEVGEDPTYNELVAIRNAIKQNYASIPTQLGGGAYGYLGGLLSAEEYELLAPGTPFTAPPHPGPTPIIEPATTAVFSGNALRLFADATRDWREWSNLERASKKQLQAALPKALLASQMCPNRGLNYLSTQAVITQLFSDWGQLSQQDLVANTHRLHDEWDANRSFTDLIQRVQEVQEYARDGQRPISDADVVDAIYTVIYNTGMFFDDCSNWDDKPTQSKTWPNFKQHFNAAQLKARRRQKAATKMGGFHGANSIHHQEQQAQLDNAESALINMLTTAAEDREQMKQKDKIIADQVLLIASLTQQLSAANAKIIALQVTKPASRQTSPSFHTHAAAATLTPPPNTVPATQTGTSPTWVDGKHKKDKEGYCWTHGYLVDPAHHSGNCRAERQNPGHQSTATRANNMGGSQYGKPRK